MNVEVRLFAYFRDGREKKYSMEIEEGATAMYILEKLDIPLEAVALLLVNGVDILTDGVKSVEAKPLKDGDIIALFPPVGGG